jgi:ABC-2 type transport system ATP-binding protein
MLQAHHLSKYYAGRPAIEDLSFTLKGGEMVGLLGCNGAGKSTTLRILSGLLLPSCGQVYIGSAAAIEHPIDIARSIGYLPDRLTFYPHLEVKHYLKWRAHLKGLRGKAVTLAVEHALDTFDLLDLRHRCIGEFSLGQQKRLGLAAALIHQPPVLLLDEPSSGLDPIQMHSMWEWLVRLKGKYTILLSSHLLREIEHICERFLLLHQGKLIADGNIETLRQRTQQHLRVQCTLSGSWSRIRQILAQFSSIQHMDWQAVGLRTYDVEMQLNHDCREEMVQKLVAANIGLRRLDVRTLALEELFLTLTQQPPTGEHRVYSQSHRASA